MIHKYTNFGDTPDALNLEVNMPISNYELIEESVGKIIEERHLWELVVMPTSVQSKKSIEDYMRLG